MDTELLNLGQKVVEELEIGDTTEKWMAHYLAELMVRVSKARTVAAREAAETQCVELIERLRDSSRARHEARAIYALQSLKQGAQKSAHDYGPLKWALDRLRNGEWPKRLNRSVADGLVFQANAAEEELLWMLLLATSDSSTVADGVLPVEEVVKLLLGKTCAAFPELADLDLAKQSSARRIRSALAELAHLRCAILG